MIDTEDVKKQSMCKSETIRLREKLIGRSCQLFYRSDPLKIVRGQGQYMFDECGTRYLDCINNVAHVGHCHPVVVRAGTEQMTTLSTNNRFLHDEMVQCAQMIVDKMPDELCVCYFVNSGSEANDLALRLAKTYTNNTDIITLDHAYHGHLTSVMDISPYKFNQPGGDPKPDYVHVTSCPDTYRGKFNVFDQAGKDLAQLYADEVDEIVSSVTKSGRSVAAFIAESFQSCGGQIIPPDGYLENVYKIVRNAGGVTIADEVQVGFGRIGTHYWAFEQQHVVPDIVTIAKPMGNGHPVGAVVCRQKIADAFANTGVCYFNTYGGNPVSCAIASAVMRVIDDEKLQENALHVGKYLLDKCTELKTLFDCVGDIRGSGLFVGIEMVADRKSRTPLTTAARWIVDRMKNVHRVLVSSDGPDNNVIKLKPPMVFNLDNANQFLNGFRECLTVLIEQEQNQLVDAIQTITCTSTPQMCSKVVTQIHEKRDCMIKSI